MRTPRSQAWDAAAAGSADQVALGDHPERASTSSTVRAISNRAAHTTWLKGIEHHVKPRTLDSYAGTLRLHILPMVGDLRVRAS